MSGFFGTTDSKWGGYLKQAISNVETTFDSLLEQPTDQKNSDTETWIDPVSGMVTTIQKPKPKNKPEPKMDKINEKSKSEPKEKNNKSELNEKPNEQNNKLKEKEKDKAQTIEQNDKIEIKEENKLETNEKNIKANKSELNEKTDKMGAELKTSEQKNAVDEKSEPSKKCDQLKTQNDIPDENNNHDEVDSTKENTTHAENASKDTKEDTSQVEKPVPQTAKSKKAAKKKAARNKKAIAKEEALKEAIKDEEKEAAAAAKEKEIEEKEATAKEVAEKEAKEKEAKEKESNEAKVLAEKEAREAKEKEEAQQTKEESKILLEEGKETKKESLNEEKSPKQDTASKELLDQRERQLLQAMETIANLHDQIHQLGEEASQNEARWKSKFESNAALEDLRKQISAKDEQIQGLLQEGEKLSKVELKHSTTIKKLRQEKTEDEKSRQELVKKLEKANADLAQASEKNTKLSESDKRSQESVKLLTDLSEQQTKHINKLESEKLETSKKLILAERSLKDALDRMETEKAKAKAEAESENAVVLEKEVKANDRLHKELTKVKENAESVESQLKKEVRDIQINLHLVQEQAALKEENLRREVNELQRQCVEQEKMHYDMSVDESTAPLLRHIDELQTQHAIAIKNRDQAEQSLIISLQHTELEYEKSLEKNKALQAETDRFTQRVDNLEDSLLDLQKENARFKTNLDLEKSMSEKRQEKIEELMRNQEEMKENEQREQEKLKNQYQRLLKERLNEEKRQFEDRLKKELKPPTLQIEEQESTEDGGKLQADIHQLQNQVDFYQTQLQSLTQSKNELSEEALNMSQEMDRLRVQVKKTLGLQKEHDQLNQRYQTLLELLGERTEEVQELKADLADVKEMYRTQVVELVQKIDQLSKK